MRGRTICKVAGTALSLLLLSAVPLQAQQTRVNDGIFLQGMDLRDMTEEQVLAAAQEKVEQLGQTQVTLTVDDQSQTCTLAELGLSWRNREILGEIFHLGATGNIVKRYKDQKDLAHENKRFRMQFVLEDSAVQSYVQGLDVFDTEPVNARIYTRDDLTPGVEGGTEGITVDTDAAARALEDLVTDWDGESNLTVELPVTRVSPEVPYEELALICDPLGSATTDYSASSYSRAINVENGCRKISGTLIYPGEGFSVTAAVTPFTAENGYEQAPSYEENRVVDSYGGGICQVSTTLYNAVLKAELEVIDRSNHTMVVSYVPLSKDAAIAEGVMDMAFVNTSDWPVYIIGSCYGGEISFTIYGHETRPANRSLEFESRTISTIEPTQAKLYPNAQQNVGYINQTQSPHTGYVAELWKNVYIDGELTESTQVNSSSYTAVGTIYDIGIATENAAVSTAIQTAIASGDLAAVQEVIANAASIAEQSQSPEDTAQEGDGTQGAGTSPGSDPADVQVDVYGDVDESVIQVTG